MQQALTDLAEVVPIWQGTVCIMQHFHSMNNAMYTHPSYAAVVFVGGIS